MIYVAVAFGVVIALVVAWAALGVVVCYYDTGPTLARRGRGY